MGWGYLWAVCERGVQWIANGHNVNGTRSCRALRTRSFMDGDSILHVRTVAPDPVSRFDGTAFTPSYNNPSPARSEHGDCVVTC